VTIATIGKYSRGVGDVAPPTGETPSANDWLSSGEAGALLGVHGRTIARWIREGRLRGRVTEGGQFRVTREEVQRLAAAQERRATQGPLPLKEEERTPPQS
jgi:excisionase family DNA binding protein